MSERRVIIETGMGIDLHGQDATKAAIRAVEDAFRRSSLPLLGALGLAHEAMRVAVTIGAQDPASVDAAAVAAHMPRGRATVDVVAGGMTVPDPDGGEPILVATAAVEAFLPDQTGAWRLDDAGAAPEARAGGDGREGNTI